MDVCAPHVATAAPQKAGVSGAIHALFPRDVPHVTADLGPWAVAIMPLFLRVWGTLRVLHAWAHVLENILDRYAPVDDSMRLRSLALMRDASAGNALLALASNDRSSAGAESRASARLACSR
jgi:hypothetical protein